MITVNDWRKSKGLPPIPVNISYRQLDVSTKIFKGTWATNEMII